MLFSYLLSILFLFFGILIGRYSPCRLYRFSISTLLRIVLVLILFYTTLSLLWSSGYLPFIVSSAVMMVFYSFLAGYFSGFGYHLYRQRGKLGSLLYVTRTLFTDHVPAFASLILILFGIFRTSLLSDAPVTGIRLTSGLSLIAAGWLGFTIRLIPELREYGLRMLDLTIPWERVLSWKWISEHIVVIECLMKFHKSQSDDKRIRVITTKIPLDQKRDFETVMQRKTDESREKRRALLEESS